METKRLTQRANWILAFSLLFVFQAGGMLLWFDTLPGSKEFMIIPFNLFGLTTDDFEPLLSVFLFSFEPVLIILGEFIGIRRVKPNKS